MNNQEKMDEKLYQYLIHLLDTDATPDLKEFLMHSDIYVERIYRSGYENPEVLHFIVNPETYKKYQEEIQNFKYAIIKKVNQFPKKHIVDTKFYPNLKIFQIVNNSFKPILTKWDEINTDQSLLINQLRTAKEKIEFQNIGNTARTIMLKLSNHVFDPTKHLASEDIDISVGKFKNRLHAYIRFELGNGETDALLKRYALSVIDSTEKAIDLANTLTHDLNGNSLIAEFCVIGTLTAISTIKLIEK